jgi:hypothetical protein
VHGHGEFLVARACVTDNNFKDSQLITQGAGRSRCPELFRDPCCVAFDTKPRT